MKTTTIEFILRAEQPIAHHEESFGNSAVAMRRKVRQADGTFQRVPIITGDTMRHGLREASSLALLDAAGMLDEPSLTQAALRLLFSGGMITGASGGSVKLGDYREMIDMIPPLALLGGCAQNRAIPGRLFVDDATLICEEVMHMMPAWVGEYLEGEARSFVPRTLQQCTNEIVDSLPDELQPLVGHPNPLNAWIMATALRNYEMDLATAERARSGHHVHSHRAHMEEVQRVRMDPTLIPARRALLAAGEADAVERRLAASEQASEEDDAIAKDATKSSMLPRRFERIAQGSLFHWSLTCTTQNALQEDTLWTMIGAFLALAHVGGKKGTGHGKIKAIHAREAVFMRPSESTAFDLSTMRKGDVFKAHMSARKDKLREYLNGVAA